MGEVTNKKGARSAKCALTLANNNDSDKEGDLEVSPSSLEQIDFLVTELYL